MRRVIPGALFTLLLCVATAAHAAISASLSDTRISSGETVQLTLQYDGLTTSEPDLAPLRRDFDILGTSSSTSVRLGTGGTSESTEVVLTLAPKHTGRLTIPPLSWDGEHSSALSLSVAGAGSAAPAGASANAPSARVFIESSITPARPYVQAQVQLAVRIYTDERLYHGSLDFSGHGAVLVKKIGTDAYRSTMRNGQTYQVITRHYALFPQQSGKLSLAGPVLDAQVAVRRKQNPWAGNPFGGFFGGLVQTARPIRVYGDPITLSVRARPAGAKGRYWLPASQVTLTAHWNPNGLTVHAGDPVTVNLELQAVGLTAAQLPNLSAMLDSPPGLKAYPDQAKLHDTTQGELSVGSRDQSVAFIANRPGRYTLPAIRIGWWNTRTNEPQTVSLPARTLIVLPASGGMSASTSAPGLPRTQSLPPTVAKSQAIAPKGPRPAARESARSGGGATWQWISAALAVMWVITLGGWFWSRRRRKPSLPHEPRKPAMRPDPSKERSAFRAACAANDAAGARQHLLSWAEAAWGRAPLGLNALAAAIGSAATGQLLRELDRACYGGGDWQGGPLAQALTHLPPRPGKPRHREDDLTPLYP